LELVICNLIKMKILKSIIYIPYSIYKWSTATKLRKILSSVLVILMFLTSIRFIFLKPKEVKASDVYLGMNEGYGTSGAVNDSNGVVSAGSITGAVWKTDDLCKSGKCLYFDGTGDLVSFTSNIAFNFYGTDGFTIEGWFRHPEISTNPDYLVTKKGASSAGYKIYMDSDGDIVFAIDDDTSWTPDDSIGGSKSKNYDDNAWHHFAAVKNGTTGIYLYVDGVLIDQKTSLTATGSLSNTANFYIGVDSDGSSNSWSGFIDEISVSHSAKTASQIAADYAGTSVDNMLAQLKNGLVGYWKMDEASAGSSQVDRADSSGNGYTLTDTNTVASTSGKFGNAARFVSGNSERLEIADNPGLDGGSAITVCAWFYQTSTSGTQSIAAKWATSGSNYQYNLQTYYSSADKIYFQISNNGSTAYGGKIDTRTLSTDTWYHACGVYDGKDVNVYLNGSDEGFQYTSSVPAGGSIYNGSTNFRIGDDGDAEYFFGNIDDVRIYNRALSKTEISFLYGTDLASHGTSASFGPDESYISDGLVGYWKMDESSWTKDASGTVLDSSGNGINGTPTCSGSCTISGITSGKFGNAGNFDGTDDYVNIGSSITYIKANEPFTVSAWANIDFSSNAFHEIVQLKSDTTEPWHLILSNQDGEWNYKGVSIGNQPDFAHIKTDTDESALTGGWHHVVVVYNGNGPNTISNYNIFLDNSPLTLSQSSDYTTGWPQNSYIGVGYQSGTVYNQLDGMVDEVRIYNRALTPAEVQRLYNWAPGPVGYWKMDENTGTSANDSSGNGNPANFGSGSNSPVWASGKFGNSIKTDGVNDYALVTHNSTLNLGATTDSYTVEAWLYKNSNGDTHIITKGNSGTSNAFMLEGWSSGYVGFYILDTNGNNTGMFTNNISVPTKTWFHLVGVRDVAADKVRLYVDGVLKVEMTDPTTATCANTVDIAFGSDSYSPGTYPFDGLIDEVKIYNYARTQKQIIEDMNAGHPAPGSPIGSAVGYWNFDEGYGDTAHNTGNGGSALDGNLAGATTCPQSGDSACPTWTNEGKYGKALDFDITGTTDDYVDAGNDTSLQLTNTGTVAFWVNYTNSTGNPVFVCKSDWHNDLNGYCVAASSGVGQIKGEVADGSGHAPIYSTNTNYNDGQWHHIVFTWDGSWLNLYIDGKLGAPPDIQDTNAVSTTYNLTFGKDPASTTSGYYLNGKLDDVYIYNFALTADQVKLLYNQGSMAVLGSTGTDSSGNADSSAAREYCPPGNTETNCAAGQNPSPVGEWKLDEKAGTTAYDTTGGHTGTLTNATWRAGKHSGGVYVNGNGHVSITDDDAFSVTTTGKLTYEGWFRLDSFGATQFPLSKRGSSSNYEWHMRVTTSGTVSCYLTQLDGTTYMSAAPTDVIYTSPGEWHYLSCVADTSSPSMSVYADGRFLGSNSSTSGSLGNGNAPVQIGEDGTGGNDMYGEADEVKIYNYARTPAQIAWDYNRGAPVAWWEMDENSWTNDCSTETVFDSSGNGLNGQSCPASTGPTGGVTGKINKAGYFDNSNDYVKIPALTKFSALGDFSITAWIMSNGTNDTILQVHDGSANATNDELRIRRHSTLGIEVKTNNSTHADTNTALTNGEWYHLAVVRSGTTLSVYLNGKLDVASSDTSGNLDLSNCNLLIGSDNDTAYCSSITPTNVYDGDIDDLRIYNYALTQQQIRTIMNDNSAVRFAPLQGSPE
jgi:hypothetical protein